MRSNFFTLNISLKFLSLSNAYTEKICAATRHSPVAVYFFRVQSDPEHSKVAGVYMIPS